MQNIDYQVINPRFPQNSNPDFPFAPPDWNEKDATAVAQSMNIEMDEERWEIVRAIQKYCSKHEQIKVRELLDALDEKFHYKGGSRYLLRKFPGGPINQGFRIAGLTLPGNSNDTAFGSVR